MIKASLGVENILKKYNIPYRKEVSDSKFYRFIYNVADIEGYALIYERDYLSYFTGVLDNEAVRCELNVEVLGTLYSFERMIQRKLGIPKEECFR